MTARERILAEFTATEGTLTYRQIATKLGIPEASVRREVRSLELNGYVALTTMSDETPRQFARPDVARARETAFP